eukprot:4664026-Amphidinium_carterae.1
MMQTCDYDPQQLSDTNAFRPCKCAYSDYGIGYDYKQQLDAGDTRMQWIPEQWKRERETTLYWQPLTTNMLTTQRRLRIGTTNGMTISNKRTW